LTVILDTSAFLIASMEDANSYAARLTFAMARHAAVDLVLVTQTPPLPLPADRLPATDLTRMCESLRGAGLALHHESALAQALSELRRLYEPFVNALAAQLQFALPPFVSTERAVDNWQTSTGMPRSPALGDLPASRGRDEHFD
jgi:hypothetical protein